MLFGNILTRSMNLNAVNILKLFKRIIKHRKQFGLMNEGYL